jgi:hypothetical protein
MGQNNIAVGHEGGYVHFWLLDFSISSSSSLDRQFGLSQSSEGFPTSFQSISADKFAGDQHVMNSQLFVINEQYGDSFIMHAETGVLLHKFSRPSVPPHILHHFSGQFNEFITFFELSILHIQGSCLHHLVFQLQYVSSDQGSKSFDLAVSTLRQRRNSQHQVVSDVKQVQRTIPSDPTEHPLIDFTGIRNGYGGNAFDYSKHHESIRNVSNEHNKSSARLFSSHSDFTPPTNLLTSDGDDNLSEKQNISTSSKLLTSMRPKASGIMDQILSRRSNPSNRAEIICTEPSHVVDFTDDNISADCAVGQTVILPLTPLPTKFDSQRLSDNREASEGMKYFHDQFRSSTRALAEDLSPTDDFSSFTQIQHNQSPWASSGCSHQEKTLPSRLHHLIHDRIPQSQNVFNVFEQKDPTSFDHLSILSDIHGKIKDEASEVSNYVTTNVRRSHQLRVDVDHHDRPLWRASTSPIDQSNNNSSSHSGRNRLPQKLKY